MNRDPLDLALRLQITDSSASHTTVHSQLIGDSGDGDKSGLGNIGQQLFVGSLIKVDSVVGLLLDLTGVPLLK